MTQYIESVCNYYHNLALSTSSYTQKQHLAIILAVTHKLTRVFKH